MVDQKKKRDETIGNSLYFLNDGQRYIDKGDGKAVIKTPRPSVCVCVCQSADDSQREQDEE